MPEVAFISKYSNHIIWINNKRVQFINGRFITSDEEIISGLKKLPEFNNTLFIDKVIEETSPDIPEKETVKKRGRPKKQ